MLHLLFVIAGNLIPLAGVLFLDWNPATIVAIFWAETLIHGTANVARIAMHRRFGDDIGRHHKTFFGKSTKPSTYLRSYAIFFYWFTLGHGIFLLAILEGLSRGKPSEGLFVGVDPGAFGRAAAAIAILAAIELGIDVASIRAKPFSWLAARVRQSNARVIVLHVAIIGGGFLIAVLESATAFLIALVVMKITFDVAAVQKF